MVVRCPLLLQDCENIHKTTSLLCQDKSGPGSFDNKFSSTCFPVTSTLSVKTHEDGEEQKNIGVPPWSSTYLHLKGDGKWAGEDQLCGTPPDTNSLCYTGHQIISQCGSKFSVVRQNSLSTVKEITPGCASQGNLPPPPQKKKPKTNDRRIYD